MDEFRTFAAVPVVGACAVHGITSPRLVGAAALLACYLRHAESGRYSSAAQAAA